MTTEKIHFESEVVLDEEEPDDGVPRVLVTGASGFIASHLTKHLLEEGRFRVRGTVRSKTNKEKVGYLAVSENFVNTVLFIYL